MLALARSRFCSGFIQSPPESRQEEYAYFLLKLVQGGGYDLLIPISDTCVGICIDLQDELKKYVRFLLPEKSSYDKVADKRLTCLFAIDRGIPIPRTYFPPDRESISALAQNDIYPCVVKLPFSSASKGVYFVNSREEMIRLYDSCDFKGQWPIVQEHIEGRFFGVTGVAHQGRILASLIHTTDQEFSLGGTPPISYSINDAALQDRAANEIKELNWSGPFNLDYLKTARRGFRMLEMNPRFPGSLNFSYRMGVDLPFVYYHLALGGSAEEIRQPDYPDGVRADAQSIETIFNEWRPTMVLVNRNDPSFAEVLGIRDCAETRLFGAAFAPVFSDAPWCLLERRAGGP